MGIHDFGALALSSNGDQNVLGEVEMDKTRLDNYANWVGIIQSEKNSNSWYTRRHGLMFRFQVKLLSYTKVTERS